MKKKFIVTLFLAGMSIALYSENTRASACKTDAITVSTRITRTIHNSASVKAIFQAAMNQTLEKWTKAAIRKYGPTYKYHGIDSCKCRVNSLDVKIGNKFTTYCTFTARACNLVHYNQGLYDCSLINTKANKQRVFKFKS